MPLKNLQQFRPWLKGLLALLAILLLAEGALRLVFGFGNIPIYEGSSQYEYALRPSQYLTRFGNDYHINEAGMRSESLKAGEFRILKFGDSVLNGGIGTDQTDLASSMLEARLAGYASSGTIRVLNVSAGSWGPDNAFAWLEKNGDFDADAIVLVFSSHDWQDQMEFRDVVGRVPFYPGHKPLLALTDAASWVYSRSFQNIAWNDLPLIANAFPEKHAYNPGWERFIGYAETKNIPLVVYHHAALAEVERSAWTAEGLELEVLLSANGVVVVSGLESGFDPGDFRDEIHPTAEGQVKIADALEPVLLNLLPNDP